MYAVKPSALLLIVPANVNPSHQTPCKWHEQQCNAMQSSAPSIHAASRPGQRRSRSVSLTRTPKRFCDLPPCRNAKTPRQGAKIPNTAAVQQRRGLSASSNLALSLPQRPRLPLQLLVLVLLHLQLPLPPHADQVHLHPLDAWNAPAGLSPHHRKTRGHERPSSRTTRGL